MPSGSRTKRHRWLYAAVPVVILVVGGWWLFARRAEDSGDPHGAILKDLLTIKHAVPRHSSIDGLVAAEPHLTDSCTSSTPDVQVDMNFASRESLNAVESAVASHLVAMGWSHYSKSGPAKWYDNINGQQVLAINSIYRWQKVLPQGVRAVATLQIGVPVTGWSPGMPLVWNFGSIAPGLGEPKRHCASG
jgi:hypothetical protein